MDTSAPLSLEFANSMTSFNGNNSYPFRNLSDELVRLVLARDPSDHRHPTNVWTVMPSSNSHPIQANAIQPTEDTHQVTTMDTAKTLASPRSSERILKSLQGRFGAMSSSFAELRKLDRREQCRVNQARYRSRQRNRKQRLEQAVEQLHHEVDRLKSRRQQLTSREIVRQSPWCIVTNLFHVLKCSFRSPWKQANVEEMTNYIDTYLCDETFLLGQLRCYSQYFGDPRIELQQIEAAAPGVLIANATLSITVTKLALRHVFPHLLVFKGTSASKMASLRDRLIGRRLDCSVSMSFMFDGETGRVATIETYIDLMAALFRVLGSLENVSQVLDHALVG